MDINIVLSNENRICIDRNFKIYSNNLKCENNFDKGKCRDPPDQPGQTTGKCETAVETTRRNGSKIDVNIRHNSGTTLLSIKYFLKLSYPSQMQLLYISYHGGEVFLRVEEVVRVCAQTQ